MSAPNQELFQLSPTDTCSAVTYTDWPTRHNDHHCTQRALYVCLQPGCEAPLCIVHLEVCNTCGKQFCEGCFSLHEKDCK